MKQTLDRKNGVDRNLYPIDGGVCAPRGFSANAIHVGFLPNETKYDLALVFADKRCPAAAVYSTNAMVGTPVTVSKRHLKYGVGYGVLINSGVANVFQENGETLTEKMCQSTATLLKVDRADILIASTGQIGPRLNFSLFENSLKTLTQGLESSHEASLRAANALMTTDKQIKQLSFRFYLGDVACTIGAIFKGNKRVSPNMATTLGVITTDVNISSEMLQRVFLSATRETFNLMDIDGVASPNDMFCIYANGRAGNYKIQAVDNDYNKFSYILKEVTKEICKKIAVDGEGKKVITYRVRGCKSKQVARMIAKKVATSLQLKKAFREDVLDRETLFCAITDVDVVEDFSKLYIEIKSEKRKIVLCEEGRMFVIADFLICDFLDASEIELIIDLKQGNFTAMSISGI